MAKGIYNNEVVVLVSNNKGRFWVQNSDTGKNLKVGKEFLTITANQAKKCEVEYQELYADKISAEKLKSDIDREVKRLIAETKTKASEYIKKLNDVLTFAEVEGKCEGFKRTYIEMLKKDNPTFFQLQNIQSLAFLKQHPDTKANVEELEELLKAEDYEKLYFLVNGRKASEIVVDSSNYDVVTTVYNVKNIETMYNATLLERVAIINLTQKYHATTPSVS